MVTIKSLSSFFKNLFKKRQTPPLSPQKIRPPPTQIQLLLTGNQTIRLKRDIKKDQLVKKNAVIGFAEYPKFGKRINHQWNQHTKKHVPFFCLRSGNTAHREDHLKYNDDQPHKSKIHQHLHKGIMRHFTWIRMRTLKKLLVVDTHKTKTQ